MDRCCRFLQYSSSISRAYVVLPMNGQGIYTTWTCIAGLINLGHCLVSVLQKQLQYHNVLQNISQSQVYEAGTDMETVSHICLGTLLAVVIVYFILENTVLDNYVRFLLTPYLGKASLMNSRNLES